MTDLHPGTVATLPKGQKAGMDLTLYGGRVLPRSFKEVVEFAQMMCKGGVAIPIHLRDNPGACLSVIQRSLAWEMDPWAVATKTYAVNDILAYESQLIAAVIQKWAPIKEKVIPYKFTGEGEALSCEILVHHAETGEEIYYQSPQVKDINPKNSPLWKSDRRQQLGYYSMRAMARRHFAGILLGVYDREEAYAMRDVSPQKVVDNYLEDGPEPEPGFKVGDHVEVTGGPQEGSRVVTEVVTAEEAHDPETGEILSGPGNLTATEVLERRAAPLQRDPAFVEKMLAEAKGPVITPRQITDNILRSIRGHSSKRMLEQWQHDHHGDINSLPADLQKEIRKVLDDKHLELEEL